MKIGTVVFALVTLVLSYCSATAQEVGPALAVDSLHVGTLSVDSLAKLDSIVWARLKAQDERLLSLKQVASQRSIDLTNDGKPEVLRLSGKLLGELGKSLLTFTIKQGRKSLFHDSWIVDDYFDTIDHLSDTAKLRRLHRYVTVAFANENFSMLDSAAYGQLLQDRSPGEVPPGSMEVRALLSQPRPMYNVFAGLNRMYGLAWLSKEKRFVKVWQN
jgi:hypothetical protein